MAAMVGLRCGSLVSPATCRVAGLGSAGFGHGSLVQVMRFQSFPAVVSCDELRKADRNPQSAGWRSDAPGCVQVRRTVRCQAFSDEEFEERDALVSRSFLERLAIAWNILFPPRKRKMSSHAEIAKQRLKMILISDRCSVNDDAKTRIVNKIVGALSDFVEIESEDRVELTVSSDHTVGTLYSIIVPVRRVRPQFQEYSRELQNAELAEDLDFTDEYKTLDVRLDYWHSDDVVDPQQA